MLLPNEIPLMKIAVDHLTGEDVEVTETGFDVAVLNSCDHLDYWCDVMRVLLLFECLCDEVGIPSGDRAFQWMEAPGIVERVGRQFIKSVSKSLQEEVHLIDLSEVVGMAQYNRTMA